jgi:hypothetical protein
VTCYDFVRSCKPSAKMFKWLNDFAGIKIGWWWEAGVVVWRPRWLTEPPIDDHTTGDENDRKRRGNLHERYAHQLKPAASLTASVGVPQLGAGLNEWMIEPGRRRPWCPGSERGVSRHERNLSAC